MKKIMFLQIKGKSFGGIWQVNKTLGNEFMNRGYEVEVCSIRDNHPGNFEETNFEQHTINKVDLWETVHRRDVLNALSKGAKKFIITFIQYLIDRKKLKIDYGLLRDYIKKKNPDYIIASHYQVLPGIPGDFLNKTIHVQHSSFDIVKKDKHNLKVLKKYNKKLFALNWLSKAAYDKAEKEGFIKNEYIYNPVRVSTNEIADTINNKTIVTLARFAPEKRIDLMVKMVDDVFQNPQFKDWTFYLYGQGNLSVETLDVINRSNQIFCKGVVSDSKDVLLNSSCSLNTSSNEGFPLSIIESLTCGVPAIIFNYGESAKEIISDGYNGFVVKQDDVETYKEKLIKIMTDNQLLKTMSENAKKSSKRFAIDKVTNEWINLFKKIDG